MSIEGGTIGSGVVGGSSMGAAVNVGPAIGSMIGRGIEGPGKGFGSTIVNERPVSPAFLENTMPISLNVAKPAIEVISNPFKEGSEPATAPPGAPVFEPLKVSDVLAQAEQIVLEARGIIQPPVVKPFKPTVSVIELPTVKPVVSRPMDFVWATLEQPQIKRALGRAISTETSTKVAQSTQPEMAASAQQQIIEEEEVVTEKKVKEPQEKEVEEIEEIRIKNLLDEEVSAERVYELDHATEQAELEVQEEAAKDGEKSEEKRLEGWRIVKYLRRRLHIGLISQIVKHKGEDGSLEETIKDLITRRFASKKEAKEHNRVMVSIYEPVRRGKEGKAVQEGAVERVKKLPFLKRGIPKEEVISRVVKKQKVLVDLGQPVVSVVEYKPEVKEPTIENYPDLADVFQKAA